MARIRLRLLTAVLSCASVFSVSHVPANAQQLRPAPARAANDDAERERRLRWFREARFGLSWVHPAQIRATVEERYIGERAGDIAGTKLDDVWTTDASLFWEPFDKRLRIGIEALNIFDADVARAFDQGIVGRSVWLSGSVRF